MAIGFTNRSLEEDAHTVGSYYDLKYQSNISVSRTTYLATFRTSKRTDSWKSDMESEEHGGFFLLKNLGC